ncbi:hypothetical protein NDU88_006853 [Pleurodeles waltl]|uniref:Uncharacterized protein n=1 Tax=Pleurodeles waltl TaxID=8319 RepID=A0AAV7MF83_PLEWA|nr:hypothetical protein NDU88_006853 [Pleurodeles waltl]
MSRATRCKKQNKLLFVQKQSNVSGIANGETYELLNSMGLVEDKRTGVVATLKLLMDASDALLDPVSASVSTNDAEEIMREGDVVKDTEFSAAMQETPEIHDLIGRGPSQARSPITSLVTILV